LPAQRQEKALLNKVPADQFQNVVNNNQIQQQTQDARPQHQPLLQHEQQKQRIQQEQIRHQQQQQKQVQQQQQKQVQQQQQERALPPKQQLQPPPQPGYKLLNYKIFTVV